MAIVQEEMIADNKMYLMNEVVRREFQVKWPKYNDSAQGVRTHLTQGERCKRKYFC